MAIRSAIKNISGKQKKTYLSKLNYKHFSLSQYLLHETSTCPMLCSLFGEIYKKCETNKYILIFKEVEIYLGRRQGGKGREGEKTPRNNNTS